MKMRVFGTTSVSLWVFVLVLATIVGDTNAWWPFEICPLNKDVMTVAALETALEVGVTNDKCGGDSKIIGQHIALTSIPFVVLEHLKDPSPKKPLVMSFVGPPGVGKTMMETRMRRVVYKNTDSDGNGGGVLVISGVDIRDKTEQEFGIAMVDRIARQVYQCTQSLIVVDEIQFMPEGSLDYLVELLGFRQPIKTKFGMIDFRHSTFLFTSNEGSAEVIEKTAETDNRNTLDYLDFAELLKARLAKREFWLAYKNRVDYYIPFLPMGRQQLREAFEFELERYKCTSKDLGSFRQLTWDDDVLNLLVDHEIETDATFAENGLSHIREELLVRVYGPIARTLRSRNKTLVDTVSLHVNGVKLKIQVQESEPLPQTSRTKAQNEL
eukprot:m.30519 g.30519  ORF g.30519 m.30519 type:complete len:382 (-) comp16298_c0_seq1:264-1409(-)